MIGFKQVQYEVGANGAMQVTHIEHMYVTHQLQLRVVFMFVQTTCAVAVHSECSLENEISYEKLGDCLSACFVDFYYIHLGSFPNMYKNEIKTYMVWNSVLIFVAQFLSSCLILEERQGLRTITRKSSKNTSNTS